MTIKGLSKTWDVSILPPSAMWGGRYGKAAFRQITKAKKRARWRMRRTSKAELRDAFGE